MYKEKMFSLPLPSVLKDQQDLKGLKFTFWFSPFEGNWYSYFLKILSISWGFDLFLCGIHTPIGKDCVAACKTGKAVLTLQREFSVVYKEPKIFQQYIFILKKTAVKRIVWFLVGHLFSLRRKGERDLTIMFALAAKFFVAVFSGWHNKDGITSIGGCHRILGFFKYSRGIFH